MRRNGCSLRLPAPALAQAFRKDSVWNGVPARVAPGQWIDDSKWNGALIGAGVDSALVLFDCARQHGKPQQCTPAALFGAAVGALVDAAIPKRARGAARSTSATSRRLSLAFGIRF